VRKELIVPKTGSGTDDDPYRPDTSEIAIPAGAIVQTVEDLGEKVRIEVLSP